ncbi:glutathione S-transferase family protein [Vibrio harveyi]|uniref:glutathione S-transferase family protein n=1 Tax=Vibrio harveyi TaxID=669 RepID=UPI003BB7BC3F
MIPNNVSALQGLHLFCNPYSNCAGRVMLAVAEKKLDVRVHIVDLLKGEQLTSEYQAINPTCDVPAIVHNGKTMGDSITILRYIEETFPETPLVSSDLQEKTQIDYLLELASKSHMEYIVPWLYAKGFGRFPTPEQKAFYDQYVPHRSQFHNDRVAGDAMVTLRESEQRIAHVLSELEQRLSQKRYLVGKDYSLADIAWFPTVYLLGRVFAYSLKDYPHVSRWMNEVEKRPAFIRGVKSYMAPIPNCMLRAMMKMIRYTGGRK